MRTVLIAATVLSMALALTLLIATTEAQPPPPPRWNLTLQFLPGEHYAGEKSSVSFKILNTDCISRKDKVLELGEMWEDEAQVFAERAEEMRRIGLIWGYKLEAYDVVYYGYKRYASWNLTLNGICGGRSITIGAVRLKFAGLGPDKFVYSEWLEIGNYISTYDAERHIIYGNDEAGSVIATIDFDFPATLKSELFKVAPRADVKLVYADGRSKAFDYVIDGEFEIKPYRTFTLLVLDRNGERPLSGARVLIKALYHEYYYREYITRANGTIFVKRLPDFYNYYVYVWYNTTYTGETLVRSIVLRAVDIAEGLITTDLYTVRFKVIDLLSRLVNGSDVEFVRLDSGMGERHTSKDGVVEFSFVPAGNYSVSVMWKGVEVYNDFIWIGYHATNNPIGEIPEYFEIRSNIGDLIVQAVDRSGNPVGAVFKVIGPSSQTSVERIEARDGLLYLQQMPVASYVITAMNYSSVFNSSASASVILKSGGGEVSHIVLPIYTAKLKIASLEGNPLPNAEVSFAGLNMRTDSEGNAKIASVPSGSYRVSVTFMNVSVGDWEVEIPSDGTILLHAKALAARTRFISLEGESVVVGWQLLGPWGEVKGIGEDARLPLLPDVDSRLLVSYENITVLNVFIRPSEMNGTVVVRLSKLRLEVMWSDGEPVQKVSVRLYHPELGEELINVIEGKGKSLRLLPLINYTATLLYKGAAISEKNLIHRGLEPIRLEIEYANVIVRVLDIMGKPIAGAEVNAYSNGVPLGEVKTDANGIAVIRRIPLTLFQGLVVRANLGTISAEKPLNGATQDTITLPLLVLQDTVLRLEELQLIFTVLTAVISLSVAMAVREARQRAKQEKTGEEL